jgi:hypothetical protein
MPVDSIQEAVLTVSPNRQYLGIFVPITPATHDPIKQKTTKQNIPITPATLEPVNKTIHCIS